MAYFHIKKMMKKKLKKVLDILHKMLYIIIVDDVKHITQKIKCNRRHNMKTITEARIKNIEGFRRAPEHDFSDDGNRFTGWEYKGLPISQHRSAQCGTFVSFRVDYIAHRKGFTYDDYSKTPWYKLCNKYNGVSELPEIEEIVKDLEIVVAGIKELEEKVKNEKLDYSKVVERAKLEKKAIEDYINKFKSEFNFWECKSDWSLKKAKEYVQTLSRKIEKLSVLIENPESDSNIRNIYQRVEKYLYLEVNIESDNEKEFYFTQLDEILSEQKN